jgi:hypothetical protein
MIYFSKYDMMFYNNEFHVRQLIQDDFKGLLKCWI